MPRAARLLVAAFAGLSRLAVGLAFAVLIASVLIQVVGRSFAGGSPVWTEELTRFALLFLVAFGVGLSFRNGELVNVDVALEAMPERAGVALRLFGALATFALCAALVMPAWRYTAIGAFQTSPAMQVSMLFVHASVLVLTVSLGLFALLRAVAMVAGWSDGRPEPDHGAGD